MASTVMFNVINFTRTQELNGFASPKKKNTHNFFARVFRWYFDAQWLSNLYARTVCSDANYGGVALNFD